MNLIESIMLLAQPASPAKYRAYLKGQPRPYLESKLRDLEADLTKPRTGRGYQRGRHTQLRPTGGRYNHLAGQLG